MQQEEYMGMHSRQHHVHERISQLLLNNGADVNAEGGEYGSALQAASFLFHLLIVKPLINNGAKLVNEGHHGAWQVRVPPFFSWISHDG